MNTSSPTDSGALSGKVGLVTGGSRGIGYATAQALIAQGMAAAITGRDPKHLETARQTLGSQSLAISADARNPDDAARAVEQTVERFGGLDVLVNNAGVGIFGSAAELSFDDWRNVLETNVSGVFYYCRSAIPHLRRRGGGWIINISSLAAKNPFAGGTAYCASKAALNAFSEALMQDVRYDNIRVSYIMPGSVATGFSGRGDQGKADWKIQPEDVAEVVVDLLRMPLRSLPSRVELRPSQPRK